MIISWAWRNLAIGDAFLVSAAVIISVLALGAMTYYYACMYRVKIVILIWKASCKLAALFSNVDFLSLEDSDDDPVMPSEYASWASAEKWRQTCIRPKDRRM